MQTPQLREVDETVPAAAREAGAPPHSMRKIWVDLLMYPTHSLPTGIAPVAIGVGLAAHDGVLAPVPALVGFLGSWAIHVAGLFVDNHELLRLHPQVVEHPELTHAVRDGKLRLPFLRAMTALCIGLSMLTVPYLYRIGGWPVIAFGVVGIVVSLAYNWAPWACVRRGHADPIFVVMFGIVGVLGTYWIQAAATQGAAEPWRLLLSLPAHVWFVGLPAGALVTSVMLIDDIRDHEFDRTKGWRTGAVRFGPRFDANVITALVAFSYLAPIAYWLWLGYDAWVLLPLASLPLAWWIVGVVRSATERTTLIPFTPRLSMLSALHSALLGLGLALSR